MPLSWAITLQYPYTVLTIKRLHDIGVSGWWAAAVLVPSLFFPILVVAVAVLGSLPGATGENHFGSPRIFRWFGASSPAPPF
jgi:uncharacterized membrane protein YhaH (DUF805 family)